MKSISWEEGGIMIDGNARDFINKLYYEDHYAIYKANKYYFNGCQAKRLENGNEDVKMEVYNLTLDTTVFSVTRSNATDCLESFQNAPIFDGKTFWEVESEIEWVDE